ncbi:MAG: DUF4190 domain-containing protein [Candidatus Hydrogenedentes bacterium]|nr:DUF4190 domain-containing protein [Candidatus Hydrogenedentota bacterium]
MERVDGRLAGSRTCIATVADQPAARTAAGRTSVTRQPVPAGDDYGQVGTFSQPVSGLAVASLILAILSWVCGGPLFAIPAVIAGHTARSRIKSAPEGSVGGSGMALAGLVLAYVNIFLFTVFLVVIVGSSVMSK